MKSPIENRQILLIFVEKVYDFDEYLKIIICLVFEAVNCESEEDLDDLQDDSVAVLTQPIVMETENTKASMEISIKLFLVETRNLVGNAAII